MFSSDLGALCHGSGDLIGRGNRCPETSAQDRPHIHEVKFNRDRPMQKAHRKDEPVSALVTNEGTSDARKRTMSDLNSFTNVEERPRSGYGVGRDDFANVLNLGIF